MEEEVVHGATERLFQYGILGVLVVAKHGIHPVEYVLESLIAEGGGLFEVRDQLAGHVLGAKLGDFLASVAIENSEHADTVADGWFCNMGIFHSDPPTLHAGGTKTESRPDSILTHFGSIRSRHVSTHGSKSQETLGILCSIVF